MACKHRLSSSNTSHSSVDIILVEGTDHSSNTFCYMPINLDKAHFIFSMAVFYLG
jgi:hypothetical protein